MFTSRGSDGDSLIDLVSSFLGPAGGSDACDGPEDAVPSTPSRDLPAPAVDAAASSGDDGTTPVGSGAVPRAGVVVFSKDRPWQLQQLLRSMELRCENASRGFRARRNLDVVVILRASAPDFAAGYEKVAREYEDEVDFLIEDDRTDADAFPSLLNRALSRESDVVLFLTDDCLLLEPLGTILACAAGALLYGRSTPSSPANGGEEGGAFNFASRLHPGISWCQTRDVPSPPPRDEMRYRPLTPRVRTLDGGEGSDFAALHDGIYFYVRKMGAAEWAYPFDLSGGAYRRRDVCVLLDGLKVEDKSHPNTLEARANELIHAGRNDLLNKRPLSAIPTRPLLLVLAVNRVQDVFRAPLALPQDLASKGGSGVCNEHNVDPSDPESLLTLLERGWHLDREKYKTNVYNSSHIGDFFIERPIPTSKGIDRSRTVPDTPKVSVLIPVHCGPPDAASDSMVSIMRQPFSGSNDGSLHQSHESMLSPMQVVIVDDRCKDGSIDAMIRACENVVKSHVAVSVKIQDHRFEGKTVETLFHTGDRNISISVDIVQSPRPGVACALNHGLKYCRAELVARMDADDIATPNRLLSQMRFMNANPSFAVVGTSALLFSSSRAGEGDSPGDAFLPHANPIDETETYQFLRTPPSITDPGFLAWAMLFSCCVPHPSVLYCKSVIQKLGGYDESISYCEDYELWLRVLNEDIRGITCLPFVGLCHRKHDRSNSSVGSTIQREEADKASFRETRRMFRDTESDGPFTCDQVSTLRNPSSANSPDCVDLASRLLLRLERSFLQKHSDHLSRQEVALIRLDCNERLGELATILVSKFGVIPKNSAAWKMWCKRCPDKQLEQLSLLCHANLTK
ncbi:hypothetical protein ACHAWF_011686 [Thalassiosira exigua]